MTTEQEIQNICNLMEYEVDQFFVEKIAAMLDEIREQDNGYGSLGRNKCGVMPWIKNRLLEMKLLPGSSGSDSRDFFVIGRFHFFRIDESVKDWNDKGFEHKRKQAGIKRSPLSRIGSASPIDQVARKIAGNGDKPCPYCKRYFRNPAAMVLHIKEVHQ
jgi:hypothetical protein